MTETKNLLASLIIIFFFPNLCFSAVVTGVPKVTEASKTAAPEENRPLTLRDCYKLALKQSELIAVDSERIKQAEAHFLEAFATLMPQVSFSRSQTKEDSANSSSYNNTFEQKFVFKQTLFSGFKEFAGISGSKFEKKQRENEKRRVEQLLFVDVSDAFYLLMEERADTRTLETIRNAFAERIDELKNRIDLGKSRNSEVASTEVQLYSLEDQIELVKSQELLARGLLEFLIGRPVDEIIESETDLTLKPEAKYLAEASFRPDVEAANFAWKTDQKKIAVAKSGFLPKIDLESDYYTHRSSAPTDSRWGTVLTIDIPIFEGTTTYGQVKEAISVARESELLFNRTGRAAIQDIHDAYVNAQADFSRTAILGKALESAERNYNLQTQDYKLNVVNNLDVLTAIQSLENIRRNFNHVSYESKRFYWHLLVAAGEINVEP